MDTPQAPAEDRDETLAAIVAAHRRAAEAIRERDRLIAHADVSQADIARATGLTTGRVAQIVVAARTLDDIAAATSARARHARIRAALAAKRVGLRDVADATGMTLDEVRELAPTKG